MGTYLGSTKGPAVVRDYGVIFCDEDDLPDGQDWTFVCCDGRVCFVVKEDGLTEEVLEDAWRAFREMEPELVA